MIFDLVNNKNTTKTANVLGQMSKPLSPMTEMGWNWKLWKVPSKHQLIGSHVTPPPQKIHMLSPETGQSQKGNESSSHTINFQNHNHQIAISYSCSRGISITV